MGWVNDIFSFNEEINGKELMALEHKKYPIYGVQFHPESFATKYGDQLIVNFINKCND